MKSLPLLLLIGFISTACNVEDVQEVAQEQVQVVDQAGDPVIDENGQPVMEVNNTTTMDAILEVVNNFFNNPNNQLLQIELYNQFNAFDDRVDDVEDNLEDINETIANMNTQIGQITGEQIANFQTEVDASLGVINGKISANETAISTLNTQMSQIQTNLVTFQERVNNQITNQNALVANQVQAAVADLNDSMDQASQALSASVDSKIAQNVEAMNTLQDGVDSQLAANEESMVALTEDVQAIKSIRNFSHTFNENTMCSNISHKTFFINSYGKIANIFLNLKEDVSSYPVFNLPPRGNQGMPDRNDSNQNWVSQIVIYKNGRELAKRDVFHQVLKNNLVKITLSGNVTVEPGDSIVVTSQLDIGSVTDYNYAAGGYPNIYGDDTWSHCINNQAMNGPKYETTSSVEMSFDVVSTKAQEEELAQKTVLEAPEGGFQAPAPEVVVEEDAEEVAEEAVAEEAVAEEAVAEEAVAEEAVAEEAVAEEAAEEEAAEEEVAEEEVAEEEATEEAAQE